ncbi:MAG: hypothetical protein AAGL34_04120 [Bacteroidota bacterium]
MAKSNSWLRTLIELIEVFFNSAQQNKRGRTWHQHVVPHEDGWAVPIRKLLMNFLLGIPR